LRLSSNAGQGYREAGLLPLLSSPSMGTDARRTESAMNEDPAPTRDAWGNLSVDAEVEYGYGLFGGKTAAEALPLFLENPMERAAELHFAPAAVFNYYVFCFVDLLLSPKGAGESDMASCFLRLVRNRLASNGADLAPVWDRLDGA
jgi:hypothetical protein